MAFLAIAPTGTVLPFAGTAAPEGWVLCNSGEYLKTSSAYAKLFAVIGIAFGETNGSGGAGTTHFRVPDMRGVFPRGSGTNGTANYGGVTGHTPAGGSVAAKGGQKTAKNGLSNGSSTVSATTGAMSTNASHTHPLSQAVWSDLAGDRYFTNQAVGLPLYGGLGVFATSTNVDHTHSFSNGTAAAQTVSSTDTETTPASLALNYIIKL